MYWGLHVLSLTVERKYAVTGISCLHIASGLLSTFQISLRIDLWHLFYSYISHIPFRCVPKSSYFYCTFESPGVLILVLHICKKVLKYSTLLYISCCFVFQDLWALFSIMLLHCSLKQDCRNLKVVMSNIRDTVMVICRGPTQK